MQVDFGVAGTVGAVRGSLPGIPGRPAKNSSSFRPVCSDSRTLRLACWGYRAKWQQSPVWRVCVQSNLSAKGQERGKWKRPKRIAWYNQKSRHCRACFCQLYGKLRFWATVELWRSGGDCHGVGSPDRQRHAVRGREVPQAAVGDDKPRAAPRRDRRGLADK